MRKHLNLELQLEVPGAFEYWLAEKEDVVKLLEKEPELYGL